MSPSASQPRSRRATNARARAPGSPPEIPRPTERREKREASSSGGSSRSGGSSSSRGSDITDSDSRDITPPRRRGVRPLADHQRPPKWLFWFAGGRLGKDRLPPTAGELRGKKAIGNPAPKKSEVVKKGRNGAMKRLKAMGVYDAVESGGDDSMSDTLVAEEMHHEESVQEMVEVGARERREGGSRKHKKGGEKKVAFGGGEGGSD